MAYDEGLAERIRRELSDQTGLTEREMFGGIAFMLGGNIACGVIDEDLMVRVGKDSYESALEQEFARPFDFTGRPMAGWVVVAQSGVEEDEQLSGWVDKGVATARSLPPK